VSDIRRIPADGARPPQTKGLCSGASSGTIVGTMQQRFFFGWWYFAGHSPA